MAASGKLDRLSTVAGSDAFAPKLERRQTIGKIFEAVCLTATLVGLVILAILLIRTFIQGLPFLNGKFISSFPSQVNPENAGIRSPLLGSIWILVLTVLFALPIGVGAAIYLEEYAQKNKFTDLLELNITNLAGVPSVVYGILGLGLFANIMRLGPVVLTGGLTMALLILPVIIVASREAIRAVPSSLREASYGLGATKWQTVSNHVLPNAVPGIITGTIIAVSRAIGEAAPLLVIGAFTFVTFDPTGPFARFTVLPLQIFYWTGLPQDEFKQLAAAAIIVLMVVLFAFNAVAIYIRSQFSDRF